MTFAWTDRDGKHHELTGPGAIVAEAEVVSAEIDRLIPLVERPEPSVRDPARTAIRAKHNRLARLQEDLERWNAYAAADTRRAADELIERIDALPGIMAAVMLVVDLQEERERLIRETAGDPAAYGRRLAAPMTDLQRRATAATTARVPLAADTSWARADAWLREQPAFARSSRADGGWFAWIDRNGHADRLPDPLSIEREMVTIAGELTAARSRLTQQTDPVALFAAVNVTVPTFERLRVLQRDLERFDHEAKARENTAWSNYAADWRTRRMMT